VSGFIPASLKRPLFADGATRKPLYGEQEGSNDSSA